MLPLRGDTMLSNEAFLLKIVEMNGDIMPLRKRGISYSQIATLVEQQIQYGNIKPSDYRLMLTKKGKAVLKKNLDKIYHRTKDQWILPQEHLYKEPIPKDKILLP